DVILKDFASSDTGVGIVQIDGVTTGLTNIGAYTDSSSQVAPTGQLSSYHTNYLGTFSRNFQRLFSGSHGGWFTGFFSGWYTRAYAGQLGTRQTNFLTSTLYQDRQSASESGMIRPLEWSTDTPGAQGVKEQDDTALNAGENIIDEAIDQLVAFGIGSYKLQVSAPAGGTWTSKGSVTDVTNSGGGVATYTLWRKTNDTAPTTIRPLKVQTETTPDSIKEMTDTDIETLTARFRNRIVATNRGYYQLQENAPGTGTWVQAGNDALDTRQVGYTGFYVTGGVGTYEGNYVSAGTHTVNTYRLWIRTA
ncbi:MAG: hypothetical protein ACR2PH_14300, partial [Desulfobulbia bacterium]